MLSFDNLNGYDVRQRAAMAFGLMEWEGHTSLPEVEKFPVHFYEDGITSLETAFKLRQMVLHNAVRSVSDDPCKGFHLSIVCEADFDRLYTLLTDIANRGDFVPLHIHAKKCLAVLDDTSMLRFIDEL